MGKLLLTLYLLISTRKGFIILIIKLIKFHLNIMLLSSTDIIKHMNKTNGL